MQSLSEKSKAYEVEIELYEEREKTMGERRQLSSTEWEEMSEQIDRLKEEKAALQ